MGQWSCAAHPVATISAIPGRNCRRSRAAGGRDARDALTSFRATVWREAETRARLAMPREIVGKGLRFSLRHAPCAHICRYCLISESRKRSALPFARFEQLVHRFHDWKQSSGRNDLQIRIFVGPSLDYGLETLQGVARLHARRGAKFQIL